MIVKFIIGVAMFSLKKYHPKFTNTSLCSTGNPWFTVVCLMMILALEMAIKNCCTIISIVMSSCLVTVWTYNQLPSALWSSECYLQPSPPASPESQWAFGTAGKIVSCCASPGLPHISGGWLKKLHPRRAELLQRGAEIEQKSRRFLHPDKVLPFYAERICENFIKISWRFWLLSCTLPKEFSSVPGREVNSFSKQLFWTVHKDGKGAKIQAENRESAW